VIIEFMHSYYDINSYNQREFEETLDEDYPGVFRKPWKDDDIYALASDYFGKDCRNPPVLEYYHYRERQWKPFRGTNDPAATALYRERRSLPLRLPQEFDDGDTRVEEDTVDDPWRPPVRRSAVAVRGVLDALVQYLRAHNYERYSSTELARRTLDPEQPWDDIVVTKQWLIRRAESDDQLAMFLLTRPGALQHLTQCLHWDRVWNTPIEHPVL
jgi:hypothetical protein